MPTKQATVAKEMSAPTTMTASLSDGGSTRVPVRVSGAKLLSTFARVTFVSAIVACVVVGLANVIADALVFALAALIAVFWSSCAVLGALPGSASSSAASAAEE